MAMITVVLAALAVVAAVGIAGEFPLSDDWSYAFATRALCTTGELRLLPWTGASLVLQAWYGAVLCRVFGFSFTLLRASTVVVATGGALGFVLLLRRLGLRGAALALASALFALNPLYVNLAFTFMTDVPFTAAAVWAGYAYVRGLDERRSSWLLIGGVAASAALLIRQHGILIAVAAALAAGAGTGRSRAARWRHAGATLALPLAVFAAYHGWLLGVHGAPLAVRHKVDEVAGLGAAAVANAAFRGVEYLGLLLCPLAVALAERNGGRRNWLRAGWTVTLATLALVLWVRERALMFYLTNVLYDLGVGALTLRDTLFLGLPPPLRVGGPLALALTVVGTAAAAVLASVWTAGVARARGAVPLFLLLALALLFAGTLLQARYYFDRYLIPVVPFAIAAAVALAPPRRVPALAVALAALLAWYAVAGTHDYLAWNRARFAGLAELAAEGVPPTAIDGGMEFNGWHLAADLDRWPSDAEVRTGRAATERSWWWVVDDRFVMSFHPLAGYDVRRTLPYRRWLVPGTGWVLVLERGAP